MDNINWNPLKERHSFVSAVAPPWHGLGRIVKGAMTSAECIEHALLNYRVEKVQTFVNIDVPLYKEGSKEVLQYSKKWQIVPDQFATYRTDTADIFGGVGYKYEVIQNIEAFEFFDNIVGEGEAIFETAGALGNGETIFITAVLPRSIKIANEDYVDQYLLLTSGHDGNRPVQIAFTPVRVVCANTLSAALFQATHKVVFKHTKSAKDKLDQAAQVLGITSTLSLEMEQLFRRLAHTEMKLPDVEAFVNSVFLTTTEIAHLVEAKLKVQTSNVITTRKKNVIKEVLTYYHTGPGQASAVDTAWGAYNAITGYYQNVKSYSNSEKKFKDIALEGTAVRNSKKALGILISKFGLNE